jgi:hypothetical protein
MDLTPEEISHLEQERDRLQGQIRKAAKFLGDSVQLFRWQSCSLPISVGLHHLYKLLFYVVITSCSKTS